ncbi:hypothetical protein Tco_0045890 [Tanacetum coccineum]
MRTNHSRVLNDLRSYFKLHIELEPGRHRDLRSLYKVFVYSFLLFGKKANLVKLGVLSQGNVVWRSRTRYDRSKQQLQRVRSRYGELKNAYTRHRLLVMMDVVASDDGRVLLLDLNHLVLLNVKVNFMMLVRVYCCYWKQCYVSAARAHIQKRCDEDLSKSTKERLLQTYGAANGSHLLSLAVMIQVAYLQKTPIRLLQKGEEDYRFNDLQLIVCGGMFKEIISQGEALKIVSLMEIVLSTRYVVCGRSRLKKKQQQQGFDTVCAASLIRYQMMHTFGSQTELNFFQFVLKRYMAVILGFIEDVINGDD